MQRLCKIMAQRGLCSRREADRWIEQGYVKVNGVTTAELGVKFPEDCEIEISPAALKSQSRNITLVLNKPLGYSCSPTREDYPQVNELLGEHSENKKLAIAGRLDINSRGLVLLTTDGRLARKIIHPYTKVDKEYVVRYRGRVTEEKLQLLRFGLSLDSKKLKAAEVTQVGSSTLVFVLREGRKRQIRRMCEEVDLAVTYLKRVRIGPIQLGGLKEGQWKLIDPKKLEIV